MIPDSRSNPEPASHVKPPSMNRRTLLTSGGVLALGQLTGCAGVVRDAVRDFVRNPVYDTSVTDALSSAAEPADPPALQV